MKSRLDCCSPRAPASRCSGPRPAGPTANDPFGKPNELLDFHLQMSRADWNALVDNRPGEGCNAVYRDFKAQFRCGTEGPWLKVARPQEARRAAGDRGAAEAAAQDRLQRDLHRHRARGDGAELAGLDGQERLPQAHPQQRPGQQVRQHGHPAAAPDGRARGHAAAQARDPLGARHRLRQDHHPHRGQARRRVPRRLHPARGHRQGGAAPALRVRRRAGWSRTARTPARRRCEFDDGPPNAAKAAYDAWYPPAPALRVRLADAEKGVDLDALLRQEAIREILVNGDDTIATSVSTGRQGAQLVLLRSAGGAAALHPLGHRPDLRAAESRTAPPTASSARPPNGSAAGARTRRGSGGPPSARASIRPRYLEIMCQLINGSMAAEEILQVWEEAYRTVKDVVPLEKDIAWDGRDPSSPAINKSFGAEYIRLKSWIPARISSVRSQNLLHARLPRGQDRDLRLPELSRRTPLSEQQVDHLPAHGQLRPGGNAASAAGSGCGRPRRRRPGAPPPAPGGTGGTGGAPPGGTAGTGPSSGGSGGSGAGPGPAPTAGASGGSPAPAPTPGGAAPPAGMPPAAAPAGMPETGGCQCGVGGRTAGTGAGWLLLAMGLAALARRKRR